MSWAPVYKLVKQIPRGRVTTYGAVAKALKLRGGARAAGYAMAACPSGQGIPWHRVVGAGGKIRLPEPHASLQRRLLESEGIEVSGVSLNFETYGWTPKKKKRAAAAKKAKRRRFARESRV
jgi:methylated-DNA-protein-cysteine methyltransferase related protein